MDIVEYFAKEWHVIGQAPSTFFIAAVLIAMMTYTAASWRFGGVMDALREQTVLLQKRLDAIPGGADSERRKQIRTALGEFLVQGSTLKRAFESDSPLDAIVEKVVNWRVAMTAYFESQLDSSYTSRLFDDAGILTGQPALSEDRLGRWRWVNHRSIRLQEFIREFA